MPTLVVLAAVKVQMFADDHHPPHFHVVGVDTEALVRLADFKVLRGRIRGRDLREALVWAEANRALLEATWEKLNA